MNKNVNLRESAASFGVKYSLVTLVSQIAEGQSMMKRTVLVSLNLACRKKATFLERF
jgi:hypothetical protein